MVPVFSTVLEAKTQKNKVFRSLRENYFQPGMSDPSKPAIKGDSIFDQTGFQKAATPAFLGSSWKLCSTTERE